MWSLLEEPADCPETFQCSTFPHFIPKMWDFCLWHSPSLSAMQHGSSEGRVLGKTVSSQTPPVHFLSSSIRTWSGRTCSRKVWLPVSPSYLSFSCSDLFMGPHSSKYPPKILNFLLCLMTGCQDRVLTLKRLRNPNIEPLFNVARV